MFMARSKPDKMASSPTPDSVNLLLSLALEEIYSTANEAQANAFLEAVGRRLAALAPLAKLRDSEQIADAMNSLWALMNWGEVAFTLDDGGVDIIHLAPPRTNEGTAQIPWDRMMPSLLAGVYAGWFDSLSDNQNLRTWVTEVHPDRIELRHAP